MHIVTSGNKFWLLFDAYRTKRLGIRAIEKRQRGRLVKMINYARSHSAYYRTLYEDLPERIEDTTILPVTNKKDLMSHFNEWITDPEVTIEEVHSFVNNPALIGEYFLDKYTVATTSGTTGERGVFLIDKRSMAVTGVLALRMLSTWLNFSDVLRIILSGRRLAMVNAMGGHFASAVAATRLLKRGSKWFQVFPVNTPLPEMVKKLNEFRPVLVASYASIARLLANQQEAGLLHINPVLVVLAAEGLPTPEYDRIARAFKARVRDSYAATECPFISYRCQYGWLHLNTDWLLLEPVDRDYKPIPAGEQSYTVLLSNLANTIQPILRYDLGDSILQKIEPCECRNPFPAIQVQGRTADILTFPADNGGPATTSIAPLVFATLSDRVVGIEVFQLVQTTPTKVRVRLKLAPEADPDYVWQTVLTEIKGLLKEHRLEHITVEQAEELPEQSQGGKYRKVIPLP